MERNFCTWSPRGLGQVDPTLLLSSFSSPCCHPKLLLTSRQGTPRCHLDEQTVNTTLLSSRAPHGRRGHGASAQREASVSPGFPSLCGPGRPGSDCRWSPSARSRLDLEGREPWKQPVRRQAPVSPSKVTRCRARISAYFPALLPSSLLCLPFTGNRQFFFF